MPPHFRTGFDRSAQHYDTYAAQQRDVLEKLVMRALPYVAVDAYMLDGGCGTGYLQQHISTTEVPWRICGLDISYAMCQMAARRTPAVLCADLQALPIQSSAFDGVLSSLALQWLKQPELAYSEAFRCLKPGGIMACSTYVRGTLSELHRALMVHDQPVWPFAEEGLQSTLAKQAGFEVCEMELEEQILSYESLHALLKQLKHIGANRYYPQRQEVMSAAVLRELEQYYNAQFRNDDGVIASWRIQYVIVRKPEGKS